MSVRLISFLQSDAVASSIADRMNIAKADILNPDDDGSSAAVKLALAETHIIQETKSYLENEGINLSSFSSLFSGGTTRQRRSTTCLLVKNIPYGTTSTQIRELFEPHGELSRVLVPPAGTIAVVDFVHPDEAAKGFKAVAYRRLGSSVIYLEKAPMGVFDASPRTMDDRPRSSNKPIEAAPITIDDGPTDNQAITPGSTLYVKNLAFSTTSDRLVSTFQHWPDFSFARVQTKPDPKHDPTSANPSPRLSMGFGFIGFKTADAAKTAMTSIQGFVLDGHSLSVKFAGRGSDDAPKGKVSATTTKMLVKNVPFEATKKDIRELFGCVYPSKPFFLFADLTSVLTVNSSPFGFLRNLMPVPVVSHSLTSSRATRQRMRMQLCDIPIFSVAIWYWNGLRMRRMILTLYARRLVLDSAMARMFQVASGSWNLWMMILGWIRTDNVR